MATLPDIIASLKRHGTPSRLPGPWARSPCPPDYFDFPEDQDRLVEQLQEEFELADLIRHQVLQRGADKRIALSYPLAANGTYLCALNKLNAKRPFDLLLGAGGTLGGGWPLMAALDDADFSARVKREGGRLFLAESAADVVILNSQGLPCAPAHGVENFSGEQIEVFRAKFGGVTPGHDSATGKNSGRRSKRTCRTESALPLSIVLVNWRPSQLSRDDVPVALAIREHLLMVADYLGIPCDDHSLWKPSAQQFERLRYVLERGTQEHVRQSVLESLDDVCVVLDRWRPGENQPPRTIAAALDSRVTIDGLGGAGFDGRALGALEQLAATDLIARQLRQVSEAQGLEKQTLHYMLAVLCRSFHSASLEFEPGSPPLGRGHRAAQHPGAMTSEVSRQQLAIAKRIFELVKELRTWQ
jgi:hypothetical protein